MKSGLVVKQEAADADGGGARLDGEGEVVAHAHVDIREVVTVGEVAEPAEVGDGRLVTRRDGHDSGQGQGEVAGQGDEGVGVVGIDPGFLRFAAEVDLDQHRAEAGWVGGLVEDMAEAEGEGGAVEAFDGFAVVRSEGGLVALKMAVVMEGDLVAARGGE